ncbi:protein kinase domain-containing protein [Accumulibacter sp.]|uniref:protein kinase domain-containing protein n=1 Tax=Accumulibacter sp. TaxID=2053492 RepID=UPI0025DB482E|nr:protein kinase [Accumulibacter sp.]MCM8594149.1 protein kinase [Accumulibacter sp.]MCM8625711.1 protein kinase [Accumulibacter sp.]MDS4048292.1 protein kinase [Accumulibacter sp.]
MEKLGKYELMREIGRGATSTVYLANDPFGRRDVAIKVAAPGILKDPKKGRLYTHLFLNEAALIGKLSHPHIVQTYDAVVDDHFCYIVMEYVAGGTLEQACNPEKLLPIERVVEIVFKCTRALDFAFRAGITHRDIKPANILLAGNDPAQGEIKISDFGAAIIGSPERTLVLGIGSPAYMSPQQVKDQPLDHRTDIYSLGVVMYQLLTGHLPFEARNSYDLIYQIINLEPRKPSALREGIPAALDSVVARAMNKKLDGRYPTWSEFAQDLARAFRGRRLNAPAEQMADLDKFDTLRSFAFFADFSDVEIWEVVRFSEWTRVPPDTLIIEDGQDGDCFYFLAEGELKVLKNGLVLELLAVGECFGEMAVIGKATTVRGADVVSLSAARLVKVTGRALQSSSETCRMHFYQAFLGVLSARLASANVRLISF